MSFVSKLNFQSPPSALHLRCLSYLTPTEAIVTAKVCKTWRLECQNEPYWVSQCHQQNVTLDSFGAVAYGIETIVGKVFSEEGIAPADSKRCWKIAKLIAEYAPDCMHKVKALVLTGGVVFYNGAWDFGVYIKASNCIAKRWGIDENEPLVCVREKAKTKESLDKWVMRKFLSFYPKMDKDHENWDLVDWDKYLEFKAQHEEIPLPGHVSLPSFMPLRCFIDKHEKYKTEDDPIRLKLNGRKIILLCTHRAGNPTPPQVVINSFTEGLQFRISTSLYNGRISNHDIDRAKELAKNNPEWISPD